VGYYLANDRDIASFYGSTNYAGALDHWIIQGLPIEGRQGSATFSVRAYMQNYPEVPKTVGASNLAISYLLATEPANAVNILISGVPPRGSRCHLPSAKYLQSWHNSAAT
jgi:hypothetical protein